MGILNFFKKQQKASAATAKERLQIVVAHERSKRDEDDFLPKLRKELLEVIAKYVKVDTDDVSVSLDQSDTSCSILELNVTLPSLDEKAAEVSLM
ncbi:MAG: cell division topological specificity factor MinE [Gammaproteobacteria bacterium]|nr:cell division topological specificity factor MinE [Gammaproteobacteria bacterium]